MGEDRKAEIKKVERQLDRQRENFDPKVDTWALKKKLADLVREEYPNEHC